MTTTQTTALMLTVSDLKQYAYCPRIVYYRYCMPMVRPVTYKMTAGQEAHRQEEGRERRRSLRAYHVADGERHFDVWLADESLGLRGKVDMLILREEEAIPVEYKDSPGRLGRHLMLQLAAYGILAERQLGLPVARGFIYYIPARRSREIALDADLREDVGQRILRMQEMILKEHMPPPPRRRNRCEICEFRRFCNDVV